MNDRGEPSSASLPETGAAIPDLPGTGGFRLQLYLVPVLLVVLLVTGWLFVYWLLHEDQDPRNLVRGMQEPGRRSWQRAYALSQLLRDPAQDALKDDADLCRALAAILSEQNRRAAEDATHAEDQQQLHFRAFLCRALGEFRLEEGLPILLDAAESSNHPREASVRAAALEAIAVLSGNIGSSRIRANRRALEVLLASSRAADSADAHISDPRAATPDLASTATFALGVVGGAAAMERLTELLGDTRPDVRYNAALGLARHAQPKALPVLLEMLDPRNRAGYQHEKTDSARKRKQALILSNAVRAAEQLAVVAPSAARADVVRTLARLSAASDLPQGIAINAKAALLRLQKPHQRD